jgi:zeaxanthin glucosyltransferase
MCSLAAELKQRGCRVVFFCIPDARPMLEAAGMECRIIGSKEFPLGSRATLAGELAALQGIAARRQTFALGCKAMEMHFRDLPQALRSTSVDALLIDQVSTAGGTIAESSGLPFVTICNALPLNREDGVPPFYSGWQYSRNPLARLRNRLGNLAMERAIRPAWDILQAHRARLGLRPYQKWSETVSPLAQICQLPREFDFPRTSLPATFHYAGPFRRAACPTGSGKRLIYASLGTVQNKIWSAYETIAEACAGLDAQLVISLGDAGSAVPTWNLAGDPVVLAYAPQLEMIEEAGVVITHAGMNTVLETLSGGVPMVAIPITNDQPGVAARVVSCGAGEALPLSKLTAGRLRTLVQRVMGDPLYRQQAIRMQQAIHATRGVERAADIVMDVVSKTLIPSRGRDYRN